MDPDQKDLRDVSVSQKQTVEIVKVLYRGADILILDEPTAVLTPQETEQALHRHAQHESRRQGHHHHHPQAPRGAGHQSDRVAVLRKGEYIGDSAHQGRRRSQSLTDMMVGHNVTLNIDRPEPVNPVKPAWTSSA